MPKMKTHKGIKGRVTLTATGRVRHKRPNAGHLMSGKSGRRRRFLRRPAILKGSVSKRIKAALASA